MHAKPDSHSTTTRSKSIKKGRRHVRNIEGYRTATPRNERERKRHINKIIKQNNIIDWTSAQMQVINSGTFHCARTPTATSTKSARACSTVRYRRFWGSKAFRPNLRRAGGGGGARASDTAIEMGVVVTFTSNICGVCLSDANFSEPAPGAAPSPLSHKPHFAPMAHPTGTPHGHTPMPTLPLTPPKPTETPTANPTADPAANPKSKHLLTTTIGEGT